MPKNNNAPEFRKLRGAEVALRPTVHRRAPGATQNIRLVRNDPIAGDQSRPENIMM